jgi:hypothetical protein
VEIAGAAGDPATAAVAVAADELDAVAAAYRKSDSVNTVRNLVEGAAGAISSNEYYAINEGNAQGLPV